MSQPEFQQIIANAPRKSLVLMSQENTAALAATTGVESVYFYAPSGFLCRLVNIYFSCVNPPAATSGGHALYMGYSNANLGNIAYGSANFNNANNLVFDYSHFFGSSSFLPNDINALVKATKSIYFDNNIGLRFQYYNQSNAQQTNVRKYYITIVQEQVAS